MTRETKTADFGIEGMSCQGCVASVKRALDRPEVVRTDVEIGSAIVEFDPSSVSRHDLEEAIEDAGFEIRPSSTEPKSQ